MIPASQYLLSLFLMKKEQRKRRASSLNLNRKSQETVTGSHSLMLRGTLSVLYKKLKSGSHTD